MDDSQADMLDSPHGWERYRQNRVVAEAVRSGSGTYWLRRARVGNALHRLRVLLFRSRQGKGASRIRTCCDVERLYDEIRDHPRTIRGLLAGYASDRVGSGRAKTRTVSGFSYRGPTWI